MSGCSTLIISTSKFILISWAVWQKTKPTDSACCWSYDPQPRSRPLKWTLTDTGQWCLYPLHAWKNFVEKCSWNIQYYSFYITMQDDRHTTANGTDRQNWLRNSMYCSYGSKYCPLHSPGIKPHLLSFTRLDAFNERRICDLNWEVSLWRYIQNPKNKTTTTKPKKIKKIKQNQKQKKVIYVTKRLQQRFANLKLQHAHGFSRLFECFSSFLLITKLVVVKAVSDNYTTTCAVTTLMTTFSFDN